MPAKGGGPPPSSGGDSPHLDILWVTAFFVILGFLGWYLGKSHIASGIFFIKYYEINAIKFVLSIWNSIVAAIHLPSIAVQSQNLDDWLNYISNVKADSFKKITFSLLVQVHTDVGKYIRFPVALILIAIASILYLTTATIKFKNIFSMDTLKNSEKQEWPRIFPVVGLNLVNQDINTGPWAMAMTPMQFGKAHKLLKEETNYGKTTVTLIRGKAYDTFALQLGALWNGNINALRPHIKALLAIFTARIDKDTNAADELLDKIAHSAISGKPNFSGSKELLMKHINCKDVVRVFQHHAYVTTMVASMLNEARIMGVMATADFIWLRPLDRKLWYMLNSVGRQAAVPEVAGVFSHWLSERRLDRPLKVPAVDAAVNSLEEAIQEIIYDPSETQ